MQFCRTGFINQNSYQPKTACIGFYLIVSESEALFILKSEMSYKIMKAFRLLYIILN